MISLEVQLRTFIYLLLFGIILAFIFDFYRVLRSFGYLGSKVTKIVDFSFCFLAGVMTFVILLKSNLGQVRLYIFLSLGLGILVYNWLFSRIIRKHLRLTLEEITKILQKCLQFIKKLYKLIRGVLSKCKEKILNLK